MKIVFMGTPDFAAKVLQKLIDEQYNIVLVVSQPDRLVGRKKELLQTAVKKMALEHEIPVFAPERIKDDYQVIIDANPDIIVTAAYGQLIPKALLDKPNLGCINVHASLLPKYRGGAPIHQAIIDGEAETGVTIMYMEPTMDTGDMIAQARLPILDTDDVGTLFEKLSEVGANLLVSTLPMLANSTAARIPQNEDDATYATNIKREQELVDWQKSARAVFNHIRGLYPWPVAFAIIAGINVKVFKATELCEEADGKAVGEFVGVSTDGIDVVCGDGKVLRLLEIQIAGRRRMPLKDLLNGDHPFVVGEKFDKQAII